MSKIIATIDTTDYQRFQAGFELDLYADGHLAATRHTQWQGSTSGERHVTAPAFCDLSKLDQDDPDNDAEAYLTGIVSEYGFDPVNSDAWRCTRRGHVIS